jgi:hypothetical protein
MITRRILTLGVTSPLPAPFADALPAWRERPRPWPQGWQAKRSFRLVAHATGLVLATAEQWRHQAGGTERRPRTTVCNLHEESPLSYALAARESPAATWEDPSTLCCTGGTPRARAGSPRCSPPFSPKEAIREKGCRLGIAHKGSSGEHRLTAQTPTRCASVPHQSSRRRSVYRRPYRTTAVKPNEEPHHQKHE